MRDVQKVTWNWQNQIAMASLDVKKHNHGLRKAAVIQAFVMAVVASLLFFVFGHELFGQIIWALAGLFLVTGLAAPAAYRPIHRFGQLLGTVIGHLLLYVLLVPLFYLFFTPIGLLLRLQKHDPMHRKKRAADKTYWLPRREKERQENISDQFMKEDKEARQTLRPVGSTGFPKARSTS